MPAQAERAQGRWADLTKRVISALVMAPVALACVWVGGAIFGALVAAGGVGLAFEWFGLCRLSRSPALKIGGLGYLVLACGALLWLRQDPSAGRADVLFLLLVVWAGDIGAYLVGRWIGGPRLAPRISPGKTWSGAIGGLLCAIVAGVLAAQFLANGPTWGAIPIAMLLGVVAQGGDLLESCVKRQLEVKDSSHLIPGHGGLLDRLDGLLAAAPVAALLALTLGRGVVLWQ